MEWFKITYRFYGPDSDFDYTSTTVYQTESIEEAESSYSIVSIT